MNQYGFLLNKLEKILDKNDIKINEPMSEHIYFKVGGPVDYLLNPKKKEQVVEIINVCRNENIPYYIIGNGSNLLVKDGGIRGVVIKLCELDNIEVKENTIISECGALLSKVSEVALDNSLTGFEFACGIPGSIGGAVYMNAGAYDGEISHVIKWAEIIDGEGKLVRMSKDELKLGYRTSYIMENGFVVIRACFELKFGDKELIKNRVDELTRRREERQPLEYPSAGSTFKRPPGYFAGKLIQDAGLKGFSLGGAAVSEKHSGFVINKGDATAKDILDLIAHIQATIKEKFGVELNTEVRIIGEEKDN